MSGIASHIYEILGTGDYFLRRRLLKKYLAIPQLLELQSLSESGGDAEGQRSPAGIAEVGRCKEGCH